MYLTQLNTNINNSNFSCAADVTDGSDTNQFVTTLWVGKIWHKALKGETKIPWQQLILDKHIKKMFTIIIFELPPFVIIKSHKIINIHLNSSCQQLS